MADTRVCEQCGTAFEPRREHARFCSARCRVAWNRETSRDRKSEDSALDWSGIAMRDTTQRLGTLVSSGWPQAFTLISEAVWWVTIVDATLVRYHPAAYDAALADQPPAERRLIEGTLAGLRFVRNRMGYHTAPCEFIQPRDPREVDAITEWAWKPLPEPVLGWLPPSGQAWEKTRYQGYQEHLAGRTIGETFGRTTAFLTLASAKSSPIEAASIR